jgi:hypothetical protein
MLTWAIQRVGYADEHVDQQGTTDVDAFLLAFDAFPWVEQNNQWDETQDGPMAALILQNEADKRKLWITALASDEKLNDSYFIAVEWTAPRKSLFGFGQIKMVEETAAFSMVGRPNTEQLCRLFCDSRYEEFDRQIAEWVRRDRDGD